MQSGGKHTPINQQGLLHLYTLTSVVWFVSWLYFVLSWMFRQLSVRSRKKASNHIPTDNFSQNKDLEDDLFRLIHVPFHPLIRLFIIASGFMTLSLITAAIYWSKIFQFG